MGNGTSEFSCEQIASNFVYLVFIFKKHIRKKRNCAFNKYIEKHSWEIGLHNGLIRLDLGSRLAVNCEPPCYDRLFLSLWYTVRLVANDMLNTTKSEDVWPPKAYDTRSDMSYTMVSNGVLGGDTRSDILRFFRIQHVVCDKSDRVS